MTTDRPPRDTLRIQEILARLARIKIAKAARETRELRERWVSENVIESVYLNKREAHPEGNHG